VSPADSRHSVSKDSGINLLLVLRNGISALYWTIATFARLPDLTTIRAGSTAT
jgi:hypothetical protein